ncbi:trigger factor [Actinobacteria bacterium YIM 96077]|uniref:Trigger factor n=1 Tax=Phytoactinopolyspora halophila TaxID=1981511 RepID=A0A329R3F4_9ACTN|nr:trigger factor [Phytoactinopolyspora halophila]AYY12190.1 trigger factor [Actinobacteria bacterium YIM 96077]RAW18576.1 trigger factor [Phytoactinopolyspora halophila]
MKSVVETLNPTRVRLAIEVPFSELEPNIKSAYKRISGQVNIPGFRKGKVPPLAIDQFVGRPVVLQEAVNDAVPKLYGDAVRENELEPLGQPEIDVSELNDGEELKFTAEVAVKPQIELPEWEGLEVQVDDLQVSDADVEERLESLRARFGTLVGVERPAADGDFVQIDLNATADGEPVEGGQASGVSYQIGKGGMIDGLDEAVTGLSAGESTTFRTTLVGTHDGQEVDCEVTVTAVKEQQLPELDDEFAQLASEFDTLDELMNDLREQATRSARIEQATEARNKVLEALLEKVGDVPVPDEIVQSQLEQHFSDGHGDDEHRGEFEQQLRQNLVQQFVLDELVQAEELEASQEELTSYVVQQAMQRGIDPNQLAQRLVDNGELPSVVADVRRGKALAMVVEKATIRDASGNPVELDRLMEDGSLAEEGASEGTEAAGAVPDVEFAELDESEQSDESDVSAGAATEAGSEADTAGQSAESGRVDAVADSDDSDGAATASGGDDASGSDDASGGDGEPEPKADA